MKWKWTFLAAVLAACFFSGFASGIPIPTEFSCGTSLRSLFHRGQQTTGRRSAPVPQLQCVGGTAQGKFAPKTVQCYNRGFDGVDVNWECTADLPREYQFGRIAVTCEGYDYPEDPTSLDYSKAGVHGGSFLPKATSGIDWTSLVYFVIIAFVLYLLYLSFTNTHDGNEGDRRRRYPGDGPDGRGPPPPYGWRGNDPPPTYDQTQKGGQSGASGSGGTGSNYGFFSGLGLGALGGYAANSFFNRRSDSSTHRRRPYTQFERDTGFYDDQAGPSHFYDQPPSTSSSSHFGSGATHTSSGFGGTERR
ncbi:hypothetical protein M3Y99_00192500 [Aphelenchoides fujianensis]|nr:hypothetical protein M3Y99_00192500 [Aphelenchoides fujianensis]